MAHEITNSDNVLLVGNRAWHGLGVIIPEAVRPTEALPLIGANWGVRQLQLKGFDPETGEEVIVPDQRLNIRDDTNQPLGIVSDHYKVFSNRQVAEFCEALVEVSQNEASPVRVETAGTIRGGKKVWFLLRGEQFAIANGDEIVPYVLVSNGHDGKTSLEVTPTTIRVVCSNTLHMVVPESVDGSGHTAAISVEHMGDLSAKIGEARRALAQYDYALRHTRNSMEILASKTIKRQQLIEFFTTCYERDVLSTLKDTDRDVINENRKQRAAECFEAFNDRFAEERDVAGVTWWNAMNAYTGMIQHDRKSRGRSDVDRVEKRVRMNLLGVNVDRAMNAFQLALEMAAAV